MCSILVCDVQWEWNCVLMAACSCKLCLPLVREGISIIEGEKLKVSQKLLEDLILNAVTWKHLKTSVPIVLDCSCV